MKKTINVETYSKQQVEKSLDAIMNLIIAIGEGELNVDDKMDSKWIKQNIERQLLLIQESTATDIKNSISNLF